MHEQNELIARIDRLERVVEELTRRLPAPADPFVPAVPARPAAAPPPVPVYAARPAPAAPERWDGQLWLNRLGIGLLLLGVAFLFRYSIDQGWLTAGVRVAFGGAVGATLLAAGLRIGDRRRFSAVLVGGGIATFYIVGYAAFSLYSLVGYDNAFAGMVAITALAFGLALARSEAALAVIGALGGLGTPLILGISRGSPRALLVYTSLIVAWTAGVYLKRGWRVLLWSALPGAWLLLLLYSLHLTGARSVDGDLAMLQAAVVFAWLCTGIFPLAMRVLGARANGRERRWRDVDTLHWYGAAIVPPAAALGITALTWDLGGVKWGIAAALCSAGYGAAAALLRARDVRLARVLLLASSVLLTGAMAAALEGNALVLGLAAQGVALHFLAHRGAGEVIRWTAHKAYAASAIWVAFDLVAHRAADPAAAATVAAVLAAGFGASYLQRRRPEVLAYRYFAHAALMGLLWRELARLGGGEGFATVAWGAYALGMLLFGMWRARPLVEKTALATVLVVVAKLFVVDLAALEAIFRILLFMGFGAVFLFFSYSLQSWLRPGRAGEQPGPDAAR